MSNVLFAKFNVNDQIYDVYSDKSLLDQILSKIYINVNQDFSIIDKEGTYKFTALDKNPDTFVINGRVVHYGPGTHVTYDPSIDDVTETVEDNKAAYVTFSFDVKSEIIGFVPKRDFGHKQFLKRFKNLIEKTAEVEGIQLFLETDTEKLTERIKYIDKVNELTVRLIPPNNDREDFKALFGAEAEELEKTGATRFFIRLFSTTTGKIEVTSHYVKKLIRAVGLGYGQIFVKGKNKSGEKVTVRSEEDAPYLRPISDINKDSIPEVAEKTRAGVVELKTLKATRRVIVENEEG